jgi:hypothetical protein
VVARTELGELKRGVERQVLRCVPLASGMRQTVDMGQLTSRDFGVAVRQFFVEIRSNRRTMWRAPALKVVVIGSTDNNVCECLRHK